MRFLYIFTITHGIMGILFMTASMFYNIVTGDIQNTTINGLLCLCNIAMLSYVIDSWMKIKDKL